MPMKKIIKILIIFSVTLLLTACGSQLPYSRDLDEHDRPPGKIAIITDEWSTESYWVAELTNRHGEDNVLIYTWPIWRGDFPYDEMYAMFNEIAENAEIKVLIADFVWHRAADHIIGTLKEQRDDIFVAYLEYQPDNDEAYASPNANLVLEFDIEAIARIFPEKAKELGADTLVYFYDSYVWSEDEIYVESEQHGMMREISAKIGLTFVEIDIYGAIQCGSSYGMFMEETIPELLSEHGTDIVLFGLDNERVFWSWTGHGFIYLPMHHSAWFPPTPAEIAYELSKRDYIADSAKGIDNTAELIEEIRAALEKRGLSGRVASWPISTQLLFPLVAYEYGMKWMNNKVPKEGSDIYVLEQIISDIIAEYTGLYRHGATLTALEENGIIHENHMLVLMDYLIYS